MAETGTVFIVDDDPAVRGSVELLIGSAGFDTKAFSSAEDFLRHVGSEARGCLLCDIDMPGLTGLELQERLLSAGFTISVIILTGKGNVSSAVQAMKFGAVDFLEKPFDSNQLLEVVHTALRRSLELSRTAAERRLTSECYESLTAREKEVFGQVVAGVASKVIAIELGISERTVEVHRSRVMNKMKARSVADLVHAAASLTPEK